MMNQINTRLSPRMADEARVMSPRHASLPLGPTEHRTQNALSLASIPMATFTYCYGHRTSSPQQENLWLKL